MDDVAGFYRNLDLVLTITRMEMRRRMVVVVHRDDDPEEAANFRHAPNLRGRGVRFDAAISRICIDIPSGS